MFELTILSSQMATTYKDKFAQSLKMLSEQTAKHRSWISDRWTDSEAGKGQEIKMLEYACGPGVISMVSFSPWSYLSIYHEVISPFHRRWLLS